MGAVIPAGDQNGRGLVTLTELAILQGEMSEQEQARRRQECTERGVCTMAGFPALHSDRLWYYCTHCLRGPQTEA